MIVIVDYGMGNLGSILNMLKKIGAPAIISNRAEDIDAADKLILPGVGAFDTGMSHLRASGLVPVLNEKVLNRHTPVLGVCLGMQLVTKGSEEGELPGLGWIDAETIRFRIDSKETNLKIPHMGWNTVSAKPSATLFQDLNGDARFYFVHSYHIVCYDAQDVVATTQYGYDFVSAVERRNIFGAQFHPEKSHQFGMRLYKNFVERV